MQIVVQDLMTHYEKQGSGPVILLLHGWADRLETFNALLPHLSGFTLVSVDLPGFGQTQIPPKAWNLDNYGDFVQAFLQKLQITDIDAVIGHSNGGAAAIRAIAQKKLTPEKLILLSSAGIRDTHGLKRAVIKSIAKVGKILTIWLPLSARQKLQKKLYGTIGSDMLVAPQMQETFKLTVRQDIQADAKQLRLPTLLIYGTADIATSIDEVGRPLANAIQDSKLVAVADADHFAHQFKAPEIAGYIQEFLA